MKGFLLSLLCSLPIFAQASTATVVAIRGDVYTANQNLEQGSLVDVGDRITTEDRSFAVLQFVDGAKVTVRPNSEIVIQEYDYDTENPSAELNLVSGGLRIITGAIAKQSPETYKVKTPVALMGVRGTEFSIMLCGDQKCREYIEE